MRETIGFIGLGVMGSPMARRLIESGFSVVVYDTSRSATEPFAPLNCRVGESVADVASASDILITMLPTSEIVAKVMLAPGGALAHLPENSLIIDMTTGSIAALEKLNRVIIKAGHRLIDAPVGRSRREAKAGRLLVIAGGNTLDVESVRPVFDAFADTIIHAGTLGSGLKLKLINNYMAMINHVLTAEVLVFAQKSGLDIPLTVDVLSTTSAGLGQLNTNFPKKVLAGDVSPDFPITMGIKDLCMAAELGECVGMPLQFGDIASAVFQHAVDSGEGNLDCTVALNVLRRSLDMAIPELLQSAAEPPAGVES